MNMSYCRFQNTLLDLRQCEDAMEDEDISDAERAARHELLRVCARLAADFCVDGVPIVSRGRGWGDGS